MAAVTALNQVCNMALGLVGQRQTIDSLDEATAEAEACSTFYDSTRRELLQSFSWRFATIRVVVGLSTETRTGWSYVYVAPADMLLEAPCRIWDGEREPGSGARVPFGLELNDAGAGHLILTDMQDAEFIYTVDLVTVALWPPLFVKAVAAQLAVYLAATLPVKPQLIPMLEKRAFLALTTAMASDGNAVQRDALADSEIIRERD